MYKSAMYKCDKSGSSKILPVRTRGQATLEMALMLPVLLMCFSAVVEWGYLFYRGMDLSAAVREGGRYAAKEKPTKDQIIQRVKDSAMFEVSKIWLLPSQVDSATGSAQAITVVGEIPVAAITPFDEIVKMMAQSSDTFRVHYFTASSTFKFQSGYDPLIFDDPVKFTEEQGSESINEGSSASGMININPGNNKQFEFYMELPDGSFITRDDLHADRTTEYTGKVTKIWLKPKGNANQNSLIVDGQPYDLKNARVYSISSDDLSLHLYNDNEQGMGKWWLGDISGNNVKIIEYGPGHGLPSGAGEMAGLAE
jgi:Flp pilus assembly protein TadG